MLMSYPIKETAHTAKIIPAVARAFPETEGIVTSSLRKLIFIAAILWLQRVQRYMSLMLKLQICLICLLPVLALAASSPVLSLYQRITLCRTFADNAGVIWDNWHTNTPKTSETWPPMADGLWSQVQQLQSRVAQYIDTRKTKTRADAAQFAYNTCRNQWPF